MSNTKSDNKYYRDLGEEYGGFDARQMRNLLNAGITEDMLKKLKDVGGKDLLQRIRNTKGLRIEQIASLIKKTDEYISKDAAKLKDDDKLQIKTTLGVMDFSKAQFSKANEVSNFKKIKDDAYAEAEAKINFDQALTEVRKRVEEEVKVEDLSPEKIVETEGIKKSKLTAAHKDFALQRISSIFNLDKKDHKKLVTDIASGKKNAHYEKAQDLLNVNTEKDYQAFLKKHNIENNPENRKILGAQRKQLQEVRSASAGYNTLRKAKTKEQILNDTKNGNIKEQVDKAKAYEKKLEDTDTAEAKKVAVEQRENNLIKTVIDGFADKQAFSETHKKILADPNNEKFNETIKEYEGKGIKGFATFKAAVKKYKEKNKQAELKAKQEKNNNAMTQKPSGASGEKASQDPAEKNPPETPNETKAQKAKEDQTATSSSYETFISPLNPKNAAGQSKESSSAPKSSSSSSSAQDINVSINLVLDDKVIQAITQKVTAGQNKN